MTGGRPVTVSSAIRVTLEQIARELSRELLKDPAFMKELKALARRRRRRVKKGGAR
jgi:hypothetical protein